MKRAMKIVGGIFALLLLLVGGFAIYVYATALKPTRPVGFQQIAASDRGHRPISAAIWYPTTAKPGFVLLGMSGARLAADAPVAGRRLPLIVFSHGTGASATSHADTAIALAEKGFVVIAPTHPGDNFQEDGDVGKPDWIANRSRHVRRVIDAALTTWKDRGHLDPGRIGVFGMSAGATTGLVTIGGRPDLRRVASHCASKPEFVCQLLPLQAYRNARPQAWQADSRIRAAVLAAPGLGFAFTPAGVAPVRGPVQLWAGSADTTVPVVTNAGLLHKLLGERAELRLVPGAAHFSFLMPCGLLAPRELCQESEGFDRAAFHRVFNAQVADFFTRHLPAGAARAEGL